jgi:cyanophycinase-like exopeptidase
MAGKRLLNIMGSGETSPTMTKIHRHILSSMGIKGPRWVMLATPFAFQENALELCDKARDYFKTSLNLDIEIVGLVDEEGQICDLDRALGLIRDADLVFSGPGSPSYAIRKLAQSPIPEILKERIANHGSLTFSSAAAITLGTKALPVYEIYKVGSDLFWNDGLDLLRQIVNKPVIVIPHFDNKEGGSHDTRYCYMGKSRLDKLETQLTDDHIILGVDEHTAVCFDLDEETFVVLGKGGVTLKQFEKSKYFKSDEVVGFDVFNMTNSGNTRVEQTRLNVSEVPVIAETRSLSEEIIFYESQIRRAKSEDDLIEIARLVLELEALLYEWRNDPTQSDEVDKLRAFLRSAISEMPRWVTNGGKNKDREEPLINLLVDLRSTLRQLNCWNEADKIREVLLAIGLEIRDEPNGTRWFANDEG